MPLTLISNRLATAAAFGRRMRKNCEGVAAVEFGFIAPIMLLMLIGTIEISRAITIDRRFGLVTSMVADLITREKTIIQGGTNILTGDPDEPNDGIYGVVQHVLGGYDNGSLKISVIPVKADPSDADTTLVYAATDNRPPLNGGVDDAEPAKCDAYELTDDLISAGSSVIVVKTSYSFSPILVGYVVGSSTWEDTAILSPRNSCVDFDDDNCVSDCFD